MDDDELRRRVTNLEHEVFWMKVSWYAIAFAVFSLMFWDILDSRLFRNLFG